jgi:hypothetical protein
MSLDESEEEWIMRKCCAWLIVGLMVLTAEPLMGQTAKPSKTYVLKAARMFDGKSNTLSTPGLVVVTAGKIAGVGGQATTPRSYPVLSTLTRTSPACIQTIGSKT